MDKLSRTLAPTLCVGARFSRVYRDFHLEESSMKKLSIGSWAYIFNQDKPTTDFHVILHKLQDLGYEGVELGSFGAHPTPFSHPTKADRQRLKKDVADHGLEFSGIAVDLWGFKKPGPSILDENPTPYMAAFLGFTVFGVRPRHQDHPRRCGRAARLLPDFRHGPEARL